MVRSIGGAGGGCARDPKTGWPAGGQAEPGVSTANRANGPNSSRSAAGRGGTAGAAGSGAAGEQWQGSASARAGDWCSQQETGAGVGFWQQDRGAASFAQQQPAGADRAGAVQAQPGPGVGHPASSVAAAVTQVTSARPIPDRSIM
jgi:hypothetical protein